MSMSTYVVGFVPPDDKWEAMRAAYDACADAGVPIPEEISKFFNWCEPDDNGAEIDIKKATRKWEDDSRQGIDVDVSQLPQHIKVIRFCNSW